MKTKNWTTIPALTIAAGLTAAAQSPQPLTPMQMHENSIADLKGRAELIEDDPNWGPLPPSSKLSGPLQTKSLFVTPRTIGPPAPPRTVSVEHLRRFCSEESQESHGARDAFASESRLPKGGAGIQNGHRVFSGIHGRRTAIWPCCTFFSAGMLRRKRRLGGRSSWSPGIRSRIRTSGGYWRRAVSSRRRSRAPGRRLSWLRGIRRLTCCWAGYWSDP